jgi:PAS domain S-box-containing protein
MTEDKNEIGGKMTSIRNILNSSSEGFVLCNSKGEITYFNQMGSEMIKKISGYTISSGDIFNYIVPEYARDSFNTSFQNAVEGKPVETERIVKTGNNESLMYLVKYFPFCDGEGKNSYVCISAKDVTEEKHLKDVVNLHREISEKLPGLNTIESALKFILDLAIDKTGMDSGGIYLRNEVTDSFELIVHRGLSENFAGNTKVVKKGDKKWDSIMNGEQIIKQHWEYESNPDDILLKENLKLVVTTPVKYGDEVIMSINIASRTQNYFPENSKELLNIIGFEASKAIHTILTEEKLNQALKKLSKSENSK